MFVAYEVTLTAIRCDPSLADQLVEAAKSAALNLAEGRRRKARDRTHLFRVGAGSAAESLAALDVAVALGYLAEADTAEVRRHLDRAIGLVWPMIK